MATLSPLTAEVAGRTAFEFVGAAKVIIDLLTDDEKRAWLAALEATPDDAIFQRTVKLEGFNPLHKPRPFDYHILGKR